MNESFNFNECLVINRQHELLQMEEDHFVDDVADEEDFDAGAAHRLVESVLLRVLATVIR